MRQTGTTFSQRYMEETLGNHARIVRKLVELFRPLRSRGTGTGAGAAEAESLGRLIEEEIDAVPSLDQDRILRGFLRLIQATLRTNYFQLGADGRPKPYLSFKLDPALVPDCRSRGPSTRSGCTRRGRRACTCGKVARGGSAGRIAARTCGAISA